MPPVKERAADRAERLLIEGILDGTYPAGSDLPGERDLCKTLGVARPALREALQRLSRDGWLAIQQGKPTRVMDLMQGGTLSILSGMLKADPRLFARFVPDMLAMWSQLAPDYTAQALEHSSREIALLLEGFRGLDDRAEPITRAMWRLHRALIDASGNVVYGLIFNSFGDFYRRLALYYYQDSSKRDEAHTYWESLREAALRGDGAQAGTLVRQFILRTRDFWTSVALYEIGEEVMKTEIDITDA